MNQLSEESDCCVIDNGVTGAQTDSLAIIIADQLTIVDGEIEAKTTLGGPQSTDGNSFLAHGSKDLNSDDGESDGSDADTELPQDGASAPPDGPGTVTKTTTSSDEFVCPNDELIAKIVAQVEFYFSDENISTDTYLMKHIKRNKQGYVSIKVITTFRKTKKLSKDPRVIAYALRNSQKLQVNEPGSKVRRIDPLPSQPAEPEVDSTLRTVVATNLAMENPTMESVVEQFSKCGNITQVRIIRPGNASPAELKKLLEKHLEVGATSVFALVEYEDLAGASKACKTLTNTGDWRRGMRVTMLVPPAKKDGAKNVDSKGSNEDRVQDSDGMGNGETKKKKVPTATLR